MVPSHPLGASPVPHFLLDATCRISFWNAACEKLFHLQAGDALGTMAHRRIFQEREIPTLADILIESGGVPPCHSSQGQPVLPGLVPGTWEALAVCASPPATFRCTVSLLREEGRITGAVMALQRAEGGPEEALRHADYVTLAENFPTSFLVTQDEHYVLVNQAFAAMLGYASAQDLIGMRSEETIAPAFREPFRRHLYEIVTHKKPLQKAWWPHQTRTGGFLWLEGNPRRVLWQGKPAVLSTLVDVTESYQRELASGTFSSVGLDEGDIRCAVRDRYRLGKIVGKSPAIRAVYERVLKAVPKEASVLITGESGTGKEVVARTIHMLSPRSKGPFVPVNCGAIPSELLESEFFGYRKGAFTGAYANKPGLLDKANRGTLFLDEVAELPLNMQVKLLRFLDDKVFVPIGSTEERSSDIRIVAATNRDLRSCIDNGTMREDFFFRLFIIPILLPPLRERKEDIPLLIEEFLYRASGGKDTPFIPGYVTDAFLRYDWPGNVRELQNTLQRYLAIGTLDIPTSAAPKETEAPGVEAGNLRELQRVYEQRLFEQALRLSGGNRAEAAKALGLPLRTFYRKLSEHAKNGS